MTEPLDAAQVRVIGALIEKEITTPDNYPLTLNSLVSACNQTSNREPVMALTDDDVMHAVEALRKRSLVRAVQRSDSRTTRYRHLMAEGMGLDAAEQAVMCVLMLRGPQTPGELRGRGERMYRFEELSDVQGTLQKLMQRTPPLVKMLPRQPGTKEARYAHLLSGDFEGSFEVPQSTSPAAEAGADSERLERLEAEVAELRREFSDLKQQMESFKRQFE